MIRCVGSGIDCFYIGSDELIRAEMGDLNFIERTVDIIRKDLDFINLGKWNYFLIDMHVIHTQCSISRFKGEKLFN